MTNHEQVFKLLQLTCKVIRIHPLINWSYALVWQVIKELEIPYCSLYDHGYTSLGSISDTLRNPFLGADEGAWNLVDGDVNERAGRVARKSGKV